METYTNYNGYGISYSSITGTTTVDAFGVPIKKFEQMGEAKGKAEAMKFINLTAIN